MWNAAGRKKKVLKHAKIKHAEALPRKVPRRTKYVNMPNQTSAEARGKKKHAGWTVPCFAMQMTKR